MSTVGAEQRGRWFTTRPDGRIACQLCPHACVIPEGGHGLCRVRFNKGGALSLPFHGRLSAVAVDPVEKKPLYHYHPGSLILSVGFVGCNLRCKFCQNWHISQTTEIETRYVEPADVVTMAKDRGSFGIAYTYSEPLVHLEWVLETAALARAAGLKNVLVSNGFVTEQAGDDALALVDAANIDLKAWSSSFYRTETGGDVEEVKRFIARAAGKIHIEVTTLVIPGKNDSTDEIGSISGFLASIDPSIPLHLSAYHPDFEYDAPPTPSRTIHELADVARGHLRFVYTGNLGAEPCDTLCPLCGAVLVHRVGYSVRVTGIRNGTCASCGAPSPVVTGP